MEDLPLVPLTNPEALKHHKKKKLLDIMLGYKISWPIIPALTRGPERNESSGPTWQGQALYRRIEKLETRPAPLNSLLNQLKAISEGDGILPCTKDPYSMRVDGRFYDDGKWWYNEVKCQCHRFSKGRHRLGHIPPPSKVQEILQEAMLCSASQSPAEEWNRAVSQKVLEAALRPPGKVGKRQLVDFQASTTAHMIPEYHAINTPPVTMDFCIYLNPPLDEYNDDAAETKRGLQLYLPGKAFNHAPLENLMDQPMAIGIAFSELSSVPDVIELLSKMGTWTAAHWQFLWHLSKVRQAAEREAGAVAPDIKQLPPFLPCITIQQHCWRLYITTRVGKDTLVWIDMYMGSTSSAMGVYQLTCSLQRLAKWVRDEYWPWLRDLLKDWPYKLYG